MSELGNAASLAIDDGSAERLLRAAIIDCRREAEVWDDQEVSVLCEEMPTAALIKILDSGYKESWTRSRISALAVSGLTRNLRDAARNKRDQVRIYSLYTLATPASPAYRFTSQTSGVIPYAMCRDDLGNTKWSTLTGKDRGAALNYARALLMGRDISVAGSEKYIACRQCCPCTEVEGAEAAALQKDAVAVIRSSPLTNDRYPNDTQDSNIRWVVDNGQARVGLEAEKVGLWRNQRTGRSGIEIAFQYNPFGEGEVLVVALGALYKEGFVPSQPMITYFETIPGTDRFAGKTRNIDIQPDDRLLVAEAIHAQIYPENLSIRQPYA